MTYYYLDASAWVKRYLDEPGSDFVEQLFAGRDPRVCSVLGVVEVTATLARKCKAREISRAALKDFCTDIDLDWRTFGQIDLDPGALQTARDVALRLALRGGDSVHLAALVSLRDRVAPAGHRVVLVASDRELIEAAEASGIETFDPAA